MEFLTLTPSDYIYPTTINRSYTICKYNFSDFDKETQTSLINEANQLSITANPGEANSGHTRPYIQRTNDSYAGLLAEYAVTHFLNSCTNNSAVRPYVTTPINQIDIVWDNNGASYTIEVRSSFVKNGIPFALYAINKIDSSPYFDVLGPYYQKTYKEKYESVKDLYFRVLFEGAKTNIIDRFINNDESFYVIGAMRGNKIINYNKHKTLQPGSSVQKYSDFSGDYFVCPINKIGDITAFKNYFLVN